MKVLKRKVVSPLDRVATLYPAPNAR